MKLDELGMITDKDTLTYLSFGDVDEMRAISPVACKMTVCKFDNYMETSLETDPFVEIGLFINNNAKGSKATWNKNPLQNESLSEHLDGFLDALQILKFDIYNRNLKYKPNVIIVSSNILPLLFLLKDYKGKTLFSNDPIYECGELENLKLKVYTSAGLEPNTIVGLVNEPPCSALGISVTEDNKFSFKVLNSNLIMKMKIVD